MEAMRYAVRVAKGTVLLVSLALMLGAAVLAGWEFTHPPDPMLPRAALMRADKRKVAGARWKAIARSGCRKGRGWGRLTPPPANWQEKHRKYLEKEMEKYQ